MNRKTSVVVLLLLVVALSLTGAMMPEQARAKTIAGCVGAGCGGGPDACLSLSVVIKGVNVGVHCYARFQDPQQY